MTDSSTIRISFRWLVIAAILFFALGMLGGLVGQQLWQPPIPITVTDGDRVVTPIQEVTISPNTAAENTVRESSRSVLALVRANDDTDTPIAHGFVITSDGLVVSVVDSGGAQLAAIDEVGQRLTLNEVGSDALFGLAYFRLPDTVVVPLDVSQDNPTAGQSHLLISRAAETSTTIVESLAVRGLSLPQPTDPGGWQQVIVGSDPVAALPGAPLINDSGRVSGVLLSGSQGRVLPISHLQQSINRILGGQREFDPLEEYGLSVQLGFNRLTDDTSPVFSATVTTVRPASSAATTGLTRGDIITAVNDEPLAWERSFVQDLAEQAQTLTVLRGEESLRLELASLQQ